MQSVYPCIHFYAMHFEHTSRAGFPYFHAKEDMYTTTLCPLKRALISRRRSLSRLWKYLRRGAAILVEHTRGISISRSRRARKSPTLLNFGVARSRTIMRVLETMVRRSRWKFAPAPRDPRGRPATFHPLTTWTVNITYSFRPL